MNTAQRLDRDNKLIEWLTDYLADHWYAPTVREVGDAFGLSSSATTSQWLTRLRKEGRIDWKDGETRTLHVLAVPAAITYDFQTLECPKNV